MIYINGGISCFTRSQCPFACKTNMSVGVGTRSLSNEVISSDRSACGPGKAYSKTQVASFDISVLSISTPHILQILISGNLNLCSKAISCNVSQADRETVLIDITIMYNLCTKRGFLSLIAHTHIAGDIPPALSALRVPSLAHFAYGVSAGERTVGWHLPLSLTLSAILPWGGPQPIPTHSKVCKELFRQP